MNFSRCRKRAVAFTLIEMTVVTAILALMAALVVPNLVAIKRSRDIRTAEAALARLPLEARNEARRSHAAVTLRIEGDEIVMERHAPPTDASAAIPEGGSGVETPSDEAEEITEVKRVSLVPDTVVETARQGTQDVDVSSWSWEVYPDGKAAESAALTLRGTDRTEKHRSLTLPASESAATWTDGDLPPAEDDHWSAGEVEQRVTTQQ